MNKIIVLLIFVFALILVTSNYSYFFRFRRKFSINKWMVMTKGQRLEYGNYNNLRILARKKKLIEKGRKEYLDYKKKVKK